MPKKQEQKPVRAFFANLGPGLITGAADDDPSGISTYSVAGAGFGYAPLWTALFSFPLMAAVQLMCARLGMVTGLGLASAIRRRYSRWVLWGACLLVVVASVVNVGADLGGMAGEGCRSHCGAEELHGTASCEFCHSLSSQCSAFGRPIVRLIFVAFDEAICIVGETLAPCPRRSSY